MYLGHLYNDVLEGNKSVVYKYTIEDVGRGYDPR